LRKHAVILNPAAGRGRASRAWPGLASRLEAAGVAFEVLETERPGQGVELAERASHRFEAVIAAGGDGTVHEVANGILRARGGAELGVLPLGSGDDFAKMLPARDAIERLAAAKSMAFDAGVIRSDGEVRYFANGMDIGFGAHGAHNIRKVPRMFTGLAAYLGAIALTMVRYPTLSVRLQLDDDAPTRQTTAMTAVMNGRALGGSFLACPDARADDGVLDVMVAEGVGRLEILGLVPKFMRGTHVRDPRIRLARARRVTIESETPLLVEADGEIAFEDARRLEIEVLPGALTVLG